jgi:hypothetical protein
MAEHVSEANSLSMLSGLSLSSQPDIRCRIAFKDLSWGDALSCQAVNTIAVDARATLPNNPGADRDDCCGEFDLILGSELMYYSTPLDLLVSTISSTLRKRGSGNSSATPSCCLLAHFYRRADLAEGLASLCTAQNLSCFDLELQEGSRDNCRAVFICWAGGDTEVFFGHSGVAGLLPPLWVKGALPLSARVQKEEEDEERSVLPDYEDSLFT